MQTLDHGCLSDADFNARRDALARTISESAGFQGQPALVKTNAHQAHAALAVVRGAGVRPGAGVTIAFMDSGIDLQHPKHAGADINKTLLQSMLDETNGNDVPVLTEPSHGTGTVSVLAAQPSAPGSSIQNDFVGLAYGAKFELYAIPLGAELSEPFDWDKAYETVLSREADILNLSFGKTGKFIKNHLSPDAVKELRMEYGGRIAIMAQKDTADPTILVWAAGNDHGGECYPDFDESCVPNSGSSRGGYRNADSPGAGNSLMTVIEELRGHTVVVVAAGKDGSIWSDSNRCGVAGSWCITAPGDGIAAASFTRQSKSQVTRTIETDISGTSFAAPMVSGGLALMKQLFRDQLSNRDLVTRMFATANKSGIYADKAIYGQGLMDLGAAVTPVGPARVELGESVTGAASYSLHNTVLRLGAAFGDGLPRALAGRQIAAFDAMGAPFWFDLPDLVHTSGHASSMTRLGRLWRPADEADRVGGTRFSFGHSAVSVERGRLRLALQEPPSNAESSLFNSAEDAATVTFRMDRSLEATAFTSASAAPRGVSRFGGLLAWRPPGRSLGMRLGWLDEPKSLLGTQADGGFGRLSSRSVVTGVEAGVEFQGWRLAADTELALVEPYASGGIITRLSDMVTSAVSFRAARRVTERDELVFSLSQPPRIERGSSSLTLPVGRTRDGAIRYEPVSAKITPSGRQIDLAVRWSRSRVGGGMLRMEAALSRDPGHIDTKPSFGVLAGWRTTF